MTAIDKALNVLELFLDNKEEIAVGAIAESCGLKKTTAHRIVSCLYKRGFLKQKRKRGKYSLGVRFLDLGGKIIKSGIGDGAVSYLTELSRLVNESVYLTVWYGSGVLLSRSFDYSSDSLASIPNDWSSMPLHHTCVGKLILANMSDKDLKKYFSIKPMNKVAPNTMVDIGNIKNQLAMVKLEGLAFEDEECKTGVRGVAASIKNADGEIIGAIFTQGETNHLTLDILVKIAPSIKICALKISKELGYRECLPGQ
jgi:IclR family transcriptional regulator, KDG regulon repressor